MDPMEPPVQNGDDSSQQLFEEARRRVDSQTPNHDSPSRQLLMEFSRMLIDSDRKFHSELDRASAEQEKKHLEALAAAAAEHERVRQSAERVAEKFRLQVEQERRRREEYEHRELERIRQENARIEAQTRQRQLDEVKRKEEEQRRAAEEARALEVAEERLRKQKAQEEADAAKRKAEQEERERKEREESAAAAAAAKARAEEAANIQQAPAPAVTNGAATATAARPPAGTNSALVSPLTEREAVHKEYLEIHQRLKPLREKFKQEFRRDPALKEFSNIRRQIRQKIGQLVPGAKENKQMLQNIRDCFTQAVNAPCFTIDVKPFLASSTQAQLPPGPFQISALLIWLFNCFAKDIINQLCTEAGVKPAAADPIGIVAVSILGNPQYCINGQIPFTDILLAKYHKCCGVLFGIYGPEKSQRGRQRLGWRQIGGEWITDQSHLERMTGLGAGWASLALRKIKVGSALVHPLPNAHYWRAFSRIVNTPPHEATPTHYMVLKAMLEGDSIDRFIQCYGQPALVALRKGLIEFPQGNPSVAAKSMAAMVETIKKEKMLTL
ncbi:Nucleoporin GLE1 [Lasiodiplodia theobromae]|uniref:mRNA export factor GLE1 n=1 Tax=Lasiodiplodia theobromae TaxID=45133 RepID=A0A5N5DC22_9PEZI|nr:Nucleoporin GLE1 [Lasiodiplodia theobromae]